ncbi:hypothetical protein [uncultured Butyricimonas sp.]|uniref:hypothetical protein n=1 Tax=uncultured Butyricimonas sp. TaxID=1268785 RepID=UPI0026DD7A3C|nr:hypothetical protein [uncultured Butyricimonas sp.]
MGIHSTIILRSNREVSYFVAYDDELVSKTKVITLQLERDVKNMSPEEIEIKIREQLGNVYIRSIGRIN